MHYYAPYMSQYMYVDGLLRVRKVFKVTFGSCQSDRQETNANDGKRQKLTVAEVTVDSSQTDIRKTTEND